MNRALLVISICCLFGAAAFADVMGPPTAGLKTGRWSAGAEYFFGQTDIEISDSSLVDFFGESSVTLKNWESDRVYGVIGYGLSDVWEVFVRLGASGADYDDLRFSRPMKFAYGFGTKYTLIEDQTLPWGILFQMSWHSAEDSGITVGEPGFDTITGDLKIEWSETKIAVGPTYNYSENMRFYGGLGFFLFDGEIKATDGVDKINVDAEQESSFGGYIGVQLNLDENTVVNIEGQFTADALGFGAGIIWKL